MNIIVILITFDKLPKCSPFPGLLSVLVMDNTSSHHGDEVEELTWGVRASAWQTRVLTVVKCQLNE